jgi:hypothetical protein
LIKKEYFIQKIEIRPRRLEIAMLTKVAIKLNPHLYLVPEMAVAI